MKATRNLPLATFCVGVALVLAATVCVLMSWLMFEQSAAGSFARRFAELLLQLAVIVVIGAVVKLLVDGYAERRTRSERDQQSRIDILRRLRALHVRVRRAQILIVAHDSGRTYSEQHRELLVVEAEVEELVEDVKAGAHLFAPDDKFIVEGLESIATFLVQAGKEYVEWHEVVDAEARAGRPLSSVLAAHYMTWTREFVQAYPDLPNTYDAALTQSKKTLRSYVYPLGADGTQQARSLWKSA